MTDTVMCVYCFGCFSEDHLKCTLERLKVEERTKVQVKKSEGEKTERWEKCQHCTHVPVQHTTLIKFMFLETKINWPLQYVHLRGLKQTNNALHTTLLSVQPSSVFAALASVHNRLLKSLS